MFFLALGVLFNRETERLFSVLPSAPSR